MLRTSYGDRDEGYSVLPERYRKILQSNLNTFYFFNFELYVFISSNDLVLKLNPEISIFNICTIYNGSQRREAYFKQVTGAIAFSSSWN